MGRAESRLRPVDRSLGGSGGATQRCAEAERSAWHRDRAAPKFFSTHLSAMLTKTEHKFYFFISFLLHNTFTLSIWQSSMYIHHRHPIFNYPFVSR